MLTRIKSVFGFLAGLVALAGSVRATIIASGSGYINTGDAYTYTVTVTQSGTLHAWTTGSTDTYGHLVNSSGTELAYDDDAGDATNFDFSYSVSPGTYQVRVHGYNYTSTGSYTVYVDFAASGGGGNTPPSIVSFTVTPASAPIGGYVAVYLNASDPNGNMSAYAIRHVGFGGINPGGVGAPPPNGSNFTSSFNYQIPAGAPLGNNTFRAEVGDTYSVPGSAPTYGIQEVTVNVVASVSPPVITSSTSASGTVGTAFSYQIAATNSPTSYSASGLPSGLSINTSTGAISGTPTQSGTVNVTIGATNAGGTGTATLSLNIAASGGSTVSGSGYGSFSFTVPANAVSLMVWTHTGCSGSDCTDPGINVTGPGGSWSDDDSYPTDGSGPSGSENCAREYNSYLKLITPAAGSYSVSCWRQSETVYWRYTTGAPPSPPVITSATSASGTVGVAFSYQITASNSPTSYSASGLPAGLSVNTSTGAITGTPTVPGGTGVTLGATNSGGTGNATLTISVASPPVPVITSATTASGTVGVAFSYQISATNSPTSYSASGLPAGLSINTATGAISGTPTAIGTTSVTVGATNSGGTGSASLSLAIAGVVPSISGQPQNQTVTAGGNASFSVTASGSGTLAYQWQRKPSGGSSFSNLSNGGSYSGATSSALAVNAATGVMTGDQFQVVVTNPAGSVTSSAATLTVNTPPVITSQPQSQTVTAGATVSFSVAATGSGPLSYEWKKDGSTVGGATGSSYSMTNVQASQAGSYTVVVTNAVGSVTSAAAILTVSGSGIPTITAQPQGGTVTAGGTTTLTVTAAGSPTLTYQWRKNGSNLSSGGHFAGVTSATLSVSNLEASDTGSYDVVVTNSLGSATSAAAGIIVQDPPVSGGGDWPNQQGTGPTKPGGGTYAVGMTKGNLSVDKSGALTYSIPLWVVPGTSGMQPQVALNYSSQAGSGIAGFGWSLGGASAITRGPKTKAVDGIVHGVDFTTADRFYLDGQRLIAIGSGTYGNADTEYRTEIDAISKIVSYGSAGTGPAYFKVWTKAGLIIEFGNTPYSAAEATGRGEIMTWAVNKISDTVGNYMTFSYFEDITTGEQRLTQIDYTGNALCLPVLGTYASVQFTYETRNDSFSGYVAGSKVSRTKRLKTVEAYYGTDLVRKYTLDYANRNLAPGDGAGRSILTAVHEADASGKDYPPLTFDYDTSTAGFTNASATWNPPGLLGKYNDNPRGSGFVELNGDGRPDFIQYHVNSGGSVVSGEYGAWFNTVNGWTAAGTAFYPPVPLVKDGVADIGTRLVDVNGDGIADLFGGDGEIYINSGSGFGADGSWFVPIPDTYPPDSWAVYSKPMFMDLNGDGRVDLISTVTYHYNLNLVATDGDKPGTPDDGTAATDGGAGTDAASLQTDPPIQAAWLNTGSGWVLTPSYYPLINMSRGSRFVDVNGDGLPDQVQHWRDQGTVEKAVALNTGVGWWSLGSTSPYVPPEMLNQNSGGTDGASVGTELVDLNVDGLVDLVHRNDAAGNAYGSTAWLNTGAGWVAAPTGFLSPYEFTHDATSKGIALLDVNSDGLPDLVQAWETSGRDVRLGTGAAWSASASAFAVARQIAQTDRPSVGTDFIDIDADGAVDQVWAWSEGSTTSGAAFNSAKPADRLKTVTNGFGVNANIFYAPLTERDGSGSYTVYDKGTGGPAGSVNVIVPMYVVKTVKNDDGVGGTYDVNYRYGGLRSDFLRGSLGFEWAQTTDARTGIVSKTTSSQVYPFIGMPVASQTKTSGGTVLSSSSMTYAEVAGVNAGTHLPYASQTTESSSDLDGSLIATTTTSVTDIDVYGNVKGMTVSTNGGFSKTTTSTYAPADTTNWILGRLTRSTVVAAATGKPSLTRTSSFDYHLTTHLLTQEVVEPDDSAMLKLTTDYQYDDWGNKKIATVTGKDINAAGQTVTTTRTTTTIYDTKGRFPDHSLNALNHQETYVYDQKLGVMTSLQGPNTLTTTWQYDTFGNKLHEGRADSTVSDVAIKWAGSSAPAGTKYFVETTATGAVPTLVFFDAFGRKLKAVGLDGNGQMIHQDTAYDSMGRAYAVSLPYRPGATIYWTQTTLYDALNRPRTVQTPDDQNGTVTTSFAYAGLTTTVTDGKLRVARTVKNSQGWVTSSTRDLNGIAAAVTYDYDALGNLTQTTASGSSTVMTYDTRGRKITMTDPDMGGTAHPWSYGYNAFGELVTQTDAKNQLTRMTYDALGRLVQRVEAEGTTTWTYDTATKGVGKPATVSAPGSYGESYTYNSYSQPESVARTIGGTTYTISQYYDSASRPLRTVYPTGFQVKNVYNAFGFVKEVRRTDGTNANLDLYWQADTYAVDGRVNGETLGNGVTGDRVYSPVTGRLLGAGVGLGTSNAVQLISYLYDQVGNVTRRNDGPTGRSETFIYDTLDRLTSHALAGGATVTVNYNVNGNISDKSDVATSYTYGSNAGPHALTAISGGPKGTQSYTYDNNGNMTGGGGRTIDWTSYNQARVIADGSGHSSTFTFGAAHERVKQVAVNGSITNTTIYVGAVFELVTSSGGTEEKNYVMTPAGRTAVYTAGTYALPNVRYFHTDALGSITVITDENGAIVKRFAYDAWGKRIDPATGAVIISTTNARFYRGFTDHEHLDDLGLIHMNGRVYDPVLGRFLSADPNVDGVYDLQGFNRYSYCQNNPMNRTDPSGYFGLKDIGVIAAVVVTGIVTAGAAVWAGAALLGQTGVTFGVALGAVTGVGGASLTSLGMVVAGVGGGFGSAFAGSLLNGGSIGDAFRAGIIGGAVGGVTAGIGIKLGGARFGSSPLRWGAHKLLHGAVGGAAEELRGGEFRHGFYASVAAKTVTQAVGFALDDAGIGQSPARYAAETATAAVVGGTTAEISGGKFENGATTAAFQYMFNQALTGAAREMAAGMNSPTSVEEAKIAYISQKWGWLTNALRTLGLLKRTSLEVSGSMGSGAVGQGALSVRGDGKAQASLSVAVAKIGGGGSFAIQEKFMIWGDPDDRIVTSYGFTFGSAAVCSGAVQWTETGNARWVVGFGVGAAASLDFTKSGNVSMPLLSLPLSEQMRLDPLISGALSEF